MERRDRERRKKEEREKGGRDRESERERKGERERERRVKEEREKVEKVKLIFGARFQCMQVCRCEQRLQRKLGIRRLGRGSVAKFGVTPPPSPTLGGRERGSKGINTSLTFLPIASNRSFLVSHFSFLHPSQISQVLDAHPLSAASSQKSDRQVTRQSPLGKGFGISLRDETVKDRSPRPLSCFLA